MYRYSRYKDASELLAKGNKMTERLKQITEYLEDIGESVLLMDGFEDALIGFSQRISEPLLAVYSLDKMVEVLMSRDGMTFDDANEYIDFNCIGAWLGEKTPVIVTALPID